MIPTLRLSVPDERARVEVLVAALRLDPVSLALSRGALNDSEAAVRMVLADVAARGDDALVAAARRFDDPNFSFNDLKAGPEEIAAGEKRVTPAQRDAIRRAIDQVREYQRHIMPTAPASLRRGGLSLSLRFTPIDSAGIYFPGGKAAYPSSLIHLATPAQVAGVKRIVACTPPSKYGRSDLVLAAAFHLGLDAVYRVGGAAAIGAMAFGTQTVPAVDKIVGPGNTYVQLAKRAVSGGVGVDGFLGPSEILIVADDSADARFVAADMLAQAEHDPGSCFLLTDSAALAEAVARQVEVQLKTLSRDTAILRALKEHSAIVVGEMAELLVLADRIAAEHVNLQTRDNAATLARLRHAGAVFIGPQSPVAAGDYVAGPSHCLPTNTTARFSSGVSVYEFLKRTSLVEYDAASLAADAPAITTLAAAEELDAHAASVRVRGGG